MPPTTPPPGALDPTKPPTPRGPSATKLLALSWDYPVHATPGPTKVAEGQTVAKVARHALPRSEALASIAGEDLRPLLVLRECLVCNGTDDALLKPGADNEKTFLLSRWFHCVKLPPDVMEADHPYHALFVQEQPEHLFVASVDGELHLPLESQTSRVELWSSLSRMVEREYGKSPDDLLKQVAKLLDKMDVVDRRAMDLERRLDELLEEEGPESRKVKKVRQDLGELQEERKALDERFVEETRLQLRRRSASR